MSILWHLSFTGNNIPHDIVNALSVAIQQNSDRQVTFEEHRQKTEALTRELEMAQERKQQEVWIHLFKIIGTEQWYHNNYNIILFIIT